MSFFETSIEGLNIRVEIAGTRNCTCKQPINTVPAELAADPHFHTKRVAAHMVPANRAADPAFHVKPVAEKTPHCDDEKVCVASYGYHVHQHQPAVDPYLEAYEADGFKGLTKKHRKTGR